MNGIAQLHTSVVSRAVNSIIRQRLLQRLGYEFQNIELFNLALTHRSYGASNNERLEFLGDSILNFVIGDWLYQRFPEAKEGDLSRLRSKMVRGDTLAEIAREFDLGPCLNLGEGEMKSGGFRRNSILADVVEAIIGAIYLDAGMEQARERVLHWYQSRLLELRVENNRKDPKTELQEFLQAAKAPLPQYDVVAVEGEDHAQQFTVVCSTSLLKGTTTASASSRKAAEKLAAAETLKRLLETR